MKTADGKTRAYKNGLAVRCACGTVFAFVGFRFRYDEHTWECAETLAKHPHLQKLRENSNG